MNLSFALALFMISGGMVLIVFGAISIGLYTSIIRRGSDVRADMELQSFLSAMRKLLEELGRLLPPASGGSPEGKIYRLFRVADQLKDGLNSVSIIESPYTDRHIKELLDELKQLISLESAGSPDSSVFRLTDMVDRLNSTLNSIDSSSTRRIHPYSLYDWPRVIIFAILIVTGLIVFLSGSSLLISVSNQAASVQSTIAPSVFLTVTPTTDSAQQETATSSATFISTQQISLVATVMPNTSPTISPSATPLLSPTASSAILLSATPLSSTPPPSLPSLSSPEISVVWLIITIVAFIVSLGSLTIVGSSRLRRTQVSDSKSQSSDSADKSGSQKSGSADRTVTVAVITGLVSIVVTVIGGFNSNLPVILNQRDRPTPTPTVTTTPTSTLSIEDLVKATMDTNLTLTATHWTLTPTQNNQATINAEVTKRYAETATAGFSVSTATSTPMSGSATPTPTP